ncbi:hypothetical protein JCGZ_09489 [Jatropha curcas]|uniref:Plastid lipid-associated protein/fibrillin conserved domain-containing protein n=1 Tax=Jatropha curcas TaxID=180498 RepID=A0A067KST3_JATCU|nr:hypothetical protein JCGZ_09489 [Jatropha curcas]
MAITKLVQPASQVVSPIPKITKLMVTTTYRSLQWPKDTRFGEGVMPIHITKVSEQSSGLVRDSKEIKETISQIKKDLYQEIQGINRGIFGVPSLKKSEIHGLVEILESYNSTSEPTLNLDKVDGCWKLLYSTITILGSKRTKLGLRDFISLGDFFQDIDVAKLM